MSQSNSLLVIPVTSNCFLGHWYPSDIVSFYRLIQNLPHVVQCLDTVPSSAAEQKLDAESSFCCSYQLHRVHQWICIYRCSRRQCRFVPTLRYRPIYRLLQELSCFEKKFWICFNCSSFGTRDFLVFAMMLSSIM